MRIAVLARGVACAIATLALSTAGCTDGSDSSDAGRPGAGGRLTAVCTTSLIADAARRVAGDRIEVIGLMGEGIDPHTYKPIRSDIAAFLGSDIALYNGLHLEGKMTDTLRRARAAGKNVHALAERLDESVLLEPAGFPGVHDPHVWMDPSIWKTVVGLIGDKLAGLDPAGETEYAANAASYAAEIEELDRYAERVLQSVPESRRVLVTSHDAFNYFGRRFGYEVVGIQGISTDSEAGVRDIERLVELIVSRRVPAVFVESTVAERNVRALVAGARNRGHAVSVGGRLFSDAMGRPGTYEGTYIGMIDHNVTTIARALGGEAPARGMAGKLAAGQRQE